MRNLKYLYVVTITNEQGHKVLCDNEIISNIANNICSWDCGNENKNLTQWNECIYNNIGLIATNGATSKDIQTLKNDIKYDLQEFYSSDEIENFKIDIECHKISIVKTSNISAFHDYTDSIIDCYKQIRR